MDEYAEIVDPLWAVLEVVWFPALLLIVVFAATRLVQGGWSRVVVRYVDDEPGAPGLGPEDARQAHRQVHVVKARVGELRSDPAWMILNPSFFDVGVEESAALFSRLGDWNEHRAQMSTQERVDAAQGLSAAFADALHRAESTGMAYYAEPVRPQALRAQRLAVKAASTTSTPERDALLAKASALLVDLLPYPLPTTLSLPAGSTE